MPKQFVAIRIILVFASLSSLPTAYAADPSTADDEAVPVVGFYRFVGESAGADLQKKYVGTERRTLLMPNVPSQAVNSPKVGESYVSPYLHLPGSPRLSFGIGIVGPPWNAPAGPEAEFIVEIEQAGEWSRLFRGVLDPQDYGESTEWMDVYFDLSPETRVARFRFSIHYLGDPKRANYTPVFGDPVILDSDAPSTTEKPSIILISLDTLRADRLGCYGYDRPTSPNLDRIAAESLLFENCYATSSWTLPSHASVFLGMLPPVHKAVSQLKPMIDLSGKKMMSQFARDDGYLTAAFTEGGFVKAFLGFDQGHDRYAELDNISETFASGLKWIQRRRNLPLFLFLHTYKVHVPLEPPEQFRERFVDAEYEGTWKHGYQFSRDVIPELSDADKRHISNLYDAEIAHMDSELGRLFARLKTLGVYESSLVIIFSDHGEQFWDHGKFGHGMSLYDEELHVPLIIKWPGPNPPSKRITEIVSLHDIFATVAEFAEWPVQSTTSQSLIPLVHSDQDDYVRDYVYSHVGARESYQEFIPEDPFAESLRTDSAKYVRVSTGTPPELYLLDDDPNERDNVHERRSKLSHELEMQLTAIAEILRKRGEENVPQEADLTDEDVERLRALGYQ